MARRLSVRAWAVLAVAVCATPAWAQQRPLVTEDPEVIGGGRLLVEVGLDYGKETEFPASGLTGNLLRAPLVGVSVGLSSIAEFQIDAGFRNRLSITDRVDAPLSGALDVEGDSTSAVDDIVLATKIRLVGESGGRPAIGVRFATKLPNASNESGLGLDTTDFIASVLVGKTVERIRVVGNVGFGILGNPLRGDAQNDVLVYGLSVARAFTDHAEFVGEVNGRVHTASADPPPGTESRGQFRLGARYTVGPGRVDGAVLVGLTPRDPSVGFAVGYTHVFNAFRLP
jgi:hypothetical protein